MIGPGHHLQVYWRLAEAAEFLDFGQGGEVVFIPDDDQAKAGGFIEKAQVHEGDGRGDKDRARHFETVYESPGRHRSAERITHQITGSRHPGVEESHSPDYIFDLSDTLAVPAGAGAHPPEIEAQSGPSLIPIGPERGPHHVIVHAAAVKRVGVGDNDTGSAIAGAEPGFESDLAGLNLNLFFHYSLSVCFLVA
jgi:hypothetical protein